MKTYSLIRNFENEIETGDFSVVRNDGKIVIAAESFAFAIHAVARLNGLECCSTDDIQVAVDEEIYS